MEVNLLLPGDVQNCPRVQQVSGASVFRKVARVFDKGVARFGQLTIYKELDSPASYGKKAMVDFQMSGMNGLDAAKQITSRSPITLILMLTPHHSPNLARQVGRSASAEAV